MNIIKGLIIKDILQLKNYRKTLVVFILIFMLVSISEIDGIGNMLALMLTLAFAMFSMASFNYDELNKTDRYILTLPITRRQVVLSKYIFVIYSTLIGSIIGTVIGFILTSLVNKQISNIGEIITIGLGGMMEIGLIEAIQIPCIYKWGTEKGRIQMVLITALVIALTGVIEFIVKKVNIQFPVNNFFDIFNKFLPVIFIVTTIIIYYISFKIAYKIYNKKEI